MTKGKAVIRFIVLEGHAYSLEGTILRFKQVRDEEKLDRLT